MATENTMRYAKMFLGGRGIDQWILYNEVKPGIWPLDPSNRLIFGAGTLVGTAVPGACRLSIDGKSAMTGGVGSSNAGGFFSAELKYAGYDHVVIQGRSTSPYYIWIDDHTVELRSAARIWGKTTWEAEDIIKEEVGDEDIQVVSIGQAGENLCRGACIIHQGSRAAGRCGLGTVMGSKNLKAVAVRGSGQITVAHPEKFMEKVDYLMSKAFDYAKNRLEAEEGKGISVMEYWNMFSGNIVRNFQDGYWDPEKLQKTSMKKLVETYGVRKLASFVSPFSVGRNYLRVSEGEYRNVEGEGYPTNSRMNWGPRVDVDYIPAIINCHVLCNQYGLDSDNTSGPISWAMECYQRGILTDEDTGGLKLEWGNYKAVAELIRMIAFREGIGDLLAEGAKRASEILGRGSEKYAMHIKGQDLWEPLIGMVGYIFGAIVSPTGGGHLRGSPGTEYRRDVPSDIGQEVYGVPTAGDRRAYKGKAKLCVYIEVLKAIMDSLGVDMINFGNRSDPHGANLEDAAEIISYATGLHIKLADVVMIGDRIHNVEKAFNVREGFTRKDDAVPERAFEPIKSGPGRGESLDRVKLAKMLDEYYELRGWNVQTGLPKRRKLEELGLTSIARDLEQLGKLR